MLVELNEKNFEDNIKSGLKLVEFYAPWCGFCQKQRPVLSDLSDNNIWIGTWGGGINFISSEPPLFTTIDYSPII